MKIADLPREQHEIRSQANRIARSLKARNEALLAMSPKPVWWTAEDTQECEDRIASFSLIPNGIVDTPDNPR